MQPEKISQINRYFVEITKFVCGKICGKRGMSIECRTCPYCLYSNKIVKICIEM